MTESGNPFKRSFYSDTAPDHELGEAVELEPSETSQDQQQMPQPEQARQYMQMPMKAPQFIKPK